MPQLSLPSPIFCQQPSGSITPGLDKESEAVRETRHEPGGFSSQRTQSQTFKLVSNLNLSGLTLTSNLLLHMAAFKPEHGDLFLLNRPHVIFAP